MSIDLIAEQYAIALDNSHPSNFEMIPNIIDHLTYDCIDEKTGESIIKRLSVFSCHLYRVLVNIGGDQNITWKNTEHLAEIANMSTGQVTKCKKEMLNKFHQLDGGSLISITERKKITTKDCDKLNGTTYHQITILNIWGFNRAYFLKKKILKENLSERARSPHESAGVARSPHESALEGARSPHERNNTPCSNTPLFKEQDSTAKAELVGSSNVSVDCRTQAFNWLSQMGFDILAATNILNNFAIHEITAASGYVMKQIERKKKKFQSIRDPLGYFRRTLENRWWENKNTSA